MAVTGIKDSFGQETGLVAHSLPGGGYEIRDSLSNVAGRIEVDHMGQAFYVSRHGVRTQAYGVMGPLSAEDALGRFDLLKPALDTPAADAKTAAKASSTSTLIRRDRTERVGCVLGALFGAGLLVSALVLYVVLYIVESWILYSGSALAYRTSLSSPAAGTLAASIVCVAALVVGSAAIAPFPSFFFGWIKARGGLPSFNKMLRSLLLWTGVFVVVASLLLSWVYYSPYSPVGPTVMRNGWPGYVLYVGQIVESNGPGVPQSLGETISRGIGALGGYH